MELLDEHDCHFHINLLLDALKTLHYKVKPLGSDPSKSSSLQLTIDLYFCRSNPVSVDTWLLTNESGVSCVMCVKLIISSTTSAMQHNQVKWIGLMSWILAQK